MTPEECAHIIEQALREGLYPSGVNDDAYYKAVANDEEEDEEHDSLSAGEMDTEAERRHADSVFGDLDVNDDMVCTG